MLALCQAKCVCVKRIETEKVEDVGVVLCVGSVKCRGGGGGKGTLHISRHGRYGLERRIGRWPGREAEVVNPTLSEKANSIKYVRYPVGLESL